MLLFCKGESWSNIFVKHERLVYMLATALMAAAGASMMAQTPGELSSHAILDHLNAVIDWYRLATTSVTTVGLPSDAIYQSDAQKIAVEVTRLAFQSAQTEAALIPAAGPASSAGATTSQQSLAKGQSEVKAHISTLQAQIQDLNQKMSRAPKAKRQQLRAQKESAQGGLNLSNATLESLDQMAQFITTNGESGKGGLEGSINELRRSVPELSSTGAVKTAAAAKPASSGLIGEVMELHDQLQGIRQITELMDQTARVKGVARLSSSNQTS
jgi:hypothetical protein